MKQLFLLVLVSFSLIGFAQNADNKLSFPKGKKLEMVSQTKAVITQELMGQPMEMNVTSSVTRSFDVEEVTKNTATIEHKIKRIQLSFDAMGQSQTFDSDKEQDLKSDMGKTIEKSLKNKYTMTVDENGNILSVKSDDDNPNVPKENNQSDMMGNILSQFTEGLDIPKAGDASSFKILPNGTIAKGQSWTDSLQQGEKGLVKYTVSEITGSEIFIDYTANGIIQKTQEAMGMQATVNLKNKTSGKITLDKKTGLLKQKTMTTEGAGTVDMAGQSVPMTNKITGSITVNGL
jgi:hypothetical protein